MRLMDKLRGKLLQENCELKGEEIRQLVKIKETYKVRFSEAEEVKYEEAVKKANELYRDSVAGMHSNQSSQINGEHVVFKSIDELMKVRPIESRGKEEGFLSDDDEGDLENQIRYEKDDLTNYSRALNLNKVAASRYMKNYYTGNQA